MKYLCVQHIVPRNGMKGQIVSNLALSAIMVPPPIWVFVQPGR